MPCKVTQRKETCLALGSIAESVLEMGVGRKISRKEAMTIMDENQKEGLVLQPANAKTPNFICLAAVVAVGCWTSRKSAGAGEFLGIQFPGCHRSNRLHRMRYCNNGARQMRFLSPLIREKRNPDSCRGQE